MWTSMLSHSDDQLIRATTWHRHGHVDENPEVDVANTTVLLNLNDDNPAVTEEKQIALRSCREFRVFEPRNWGNAIRMWAQGQKTWNSSQESKNGFLGRECRCLEEWGEWRKQQRSSSSTWMGKRHYTFTAFVPGNQMWIGNRIVDLFCHKWGWQRFDTTNQACSLIANMDASSAAVVKPNSAAWLDFNTHCCLKSWWSCSATALDGVVRERSNVQDCDCVGAKNTEPHNSSN